MTMTNDEDTMRHVLSHIQRPALLAAAVRETPDHSTPPKQLRALLRRLRGRTLILVDGDNFPGAAQLGLDHFPPPLSPDLDLGFLVIAFVSAAANFRAFQRAVAQPWFAFVHAQTNAKDAADHALSITASMANEVADITSEFCVLSRDGFAREAVQFLKALEPDRSVRLISVVEYDTMLKQFERRTQYVPGSSLATPALSSNPFGIIMTDVPPLPLPLTQPQQRPAADADDKPDLRALPWRDYVCPICHTPGGLPNSHYHWQCPNKPGPGTDTAAVAGRFPNPVDIASSSSSSDPVVVLAWRREEERFAKFLDIIVQTYVMRDIEFVRLSTLGVVMREHFVYAEKAGLKPLVERACQLGLATRQGEQGLAEMVFQKEALLKYAREHPPPPPLPGVAPIRDPQAPAAAAPDHW